MNQTPVSRALLGVALLPRDRLCVVLVLDVVLVVDVVLRVVLVRREELLLREQMQAARAVVAHAVAPVEARGWKRGENRHQYVN